MLFRSAETTEGHSDSYIGGVIGHTQLDLWSRSFHAFHDARPRYDQAQFVDVSFDDFRADQVGTVRSIYQAFDLDWTPAVEAAVREADEELKGGGKAPSHRYALKDYGLTEDRVRAAFER